MRNKKVLFAVQAAMIAALYVVLTYITNLLGLASGTIQVRFSEALCILPVFTPAAIPGLFIGCLISNLITGGLIGRHPVDFLFQYHYTDCQQINNNQILEAVQKQNSFQNLLRKVSYFAAKRNQHQRSPDEVYAQCHSRGSDGAFADQALFQNYRDGALPPGRHQPRNLLHPLF